MDKGDNTFVTLILILLVMLGLGFYLYKSGYLKTSSPGSFVGNSTNNTSDIKNESKAGLSESEIKNTTYGKIALDVTYPLNGAKLGSTNVKVTGKTTPNADVFVNDQIGKADKDGNFSISIGLDEGENQIVVSANDKDGNVNEQEILVTISSFE